jgi:O-antigen/teichoic acid export membrane protein
MNFKIPQQASTRVVMNTGILYAKMGVTMFISLYTTRLILNSLGASDFGIFNIVGGAIAMLGFLNAAMAGATQRFMSYSEGTGDKDKQKSIFNVSVILHFCIALLLGVVLLIAGYFFFNGILNIPADRMHAARMVYYFMIISTMLTVMTVPYDAVLNAHENMLYYAIVGIIESVLKLAVAFVVVYTLADKLIIYGLLMACISLTVMIIMRVYCKKKYVECEFRPRTYYDKPLMREMTGFAGWSFLSSFSSIIGQNGLGIVLNHFFGAMLNAAQGIANQLCGQLQVFSNTMLKALNPVITKSEGAGNRFQMLQSSMIGCKFSFFLVAFFAIPFLIDAPYVMGIWLKNVPEWCVAFFRFQIARTLIEQLTIVLGVSISAQGDIANISKIKSILNILPIIFTAIVFYLGYSPYWMYISWIFCWSILGGGVTIHYAMIKCNLLIKDYINKVILRCLPLFCIVLCVSIIPYSLMSVGISRFLCISIVSSISFILLSWAFFLDNSEKEIIERTFNLLKIKVLKRQSQNSQIKFLDSK